VKFVLYGLRHLLLGPYLMYLLAGVAFCAAALAVRDGGGPRDYVFDVLMALVGLYALRTGWKTKEERPLEQIDALEALDQVMREHGPDKPDPSEDEKERRLHIATKAAAIRLFLPATRPPGWSAPLAPRGTSAVHVGTGRERVILTLSFLASSSCALRVSILPLPGDTKPVGLERCKEILGHLEQIEEWVEPDQEFPVARVWLGRSELLTQEPSYEVPAAAPKARPRRLTEHAEEIRERHLPRRLPDDWSVPVSMPRRDGWMFEAEIFFVMVVLCTTEDGVRLLVSLMHTGRGELTPTAHVSVLGQFRNVGTFSEGEPLEEKQTIAYFADLLPGGRYDGLRASKAKDASGGSQGLN
jgi:hypothetical protein